MPHGQIVNAKDDSNLRAAADILLAGGVVAFPTETVYGLGADAANEKAVCKIFEIKKRPSFDPLIVHVSSPEQASLLWAEVPELASKLIRHFWPGPLTLVLPKKTTVSDVVTSGLPTVAVRMPKNPAALKLIECLGRPIAAPSANLFGYTSPTTAQAVFEDLGPNVDMILDDGPAVVGLESTVIKIEEGRCILLRPGGISVEEIEKFAPVIRGSAAEGVYESPGLLRSHYAPWTPLVLFEGSGEALLQQLKGFQKILSDKQLLPLRVGLISFHEKLSTAVFETQELLSPAGDLYEAAANLFQAIRKLDKMHLDLIVARGVPTKGIGLAIMDRLEKAAGGQKELQPFFENWKR